GDGLGRYVFLFLRYQDVGQGGARVGGRFGQQVGVAVGLLQGCAGQVGAGVDPGGEQSGGVQGTFQGGGVFLCQAVGETYQLPQGGALAPVSWGGTQRVHGGCV